MEAKDTDTVMTMATINTIMEQKSKNGDGETVTGWCRIIAKAQAKISFKAGYQAGLRQQGTPLMDAESRLVEEEYRMKVHEELRKDHTEIEQFKEAKDTQLFFIINYKGERIDLTKEFRRQAKYSFKRGQDDGFNIGLEQGEAEGIKEVVEWIESNGHQDSVIYSEWQAFLKDIGYKEKE